ncbi:MAG: class I mannose-6-phosphate isomerase [Oscillospiraceae bacterium]|nr:class I mannose-6-phosphate isomerase [Oscillospiraceae bacterium]
MNRPFLLKPAAKDYLWGGSRLNDDFGKAIPLSPLAETWECSTHPDGQSMVTETGEPLGTLLSHCPGYLGSHALRLAGGKAELPILIKLIDAKQDLSIQVHPDDDYALEHENSRGKTEMWYILAAKRNAELIYGFRQELSREQLARVLDEKRVESVLNHVPVRQNDVFFVEAGIVHAIGAGVLLAEIQESSNVTYRLYDYERTDKAGRKRNLHIQKALDVAKLTASVSPRQPMRVLKYRNGCAEELLGRCKYFQVGRILLNTEIQRNFAEYQTDGNSFHVLLCIEGCGVLFGEHVMIPFFKGDCIFVPAESIPLKLHGKAQLLNISC